MSEGPSRVEQWFAREQHPAALPELRRLADTLRRVSDRLHEADPGPGELADLQALAARLEAAAEGVRRVDRSDAPFEELPPDALGFLDRSPMSGAVNPSAPPMELSSAEGVVRGVVTFGPSFEGPPGHVHGGWVASGFDEVMGMAQALGSDPGMTAKLEIFYRKPTPLGVELTFEGWIDVVRGRKIRCKGELRGPDDVLLANAEGLFVSVDFEAMRALMEAASD